MRVVFRDPNAPVVVGAATVLQRCDDPSVAVEPMGLVRTALEAAADDAGSRHLLDLADVILLPQGTWQSARPSDVAAPWNPAIRCVVADLGVLQQTLVSRACATVAAGGADVVLVAGGEARYRWLRAQIAGTTIADTVTSGAPDERLAPAAGIITAEEITRGLPVPARQYAMIDTALRQAQGMTPSELREALADLQQRCSVVASANPHGWRRDIADHTELLAGSLRNPMLAWPYTKLHCSQWNVDQAAALIICSAAAAERLGIRRDRWVFAHLGIESNAMVPLTHRRDLHRLPAASIAGAVLTERTGVVAADVDHLELYSCFPAALRVQAAELGIDITRPITVTGGMTFGGGPFNNASLQALATMVPVLRGDPTSTGVVSNISGMLTKFGLSLWSATPPSSPFTAVDITEVAEAATAISPFAPDHAGSARVLTYTVAHDAGVAQQGIVIGETSDGTRVLATTDDTQLMADMMTTEWCDREVTVDGARLVEA